MKTLKIAIAALVITSILTSATTSFAADIAFVTTMVHAAIKGVRARDAAKKLPDASWLTEENVSAVVVPVEQGLNEEQEEVKKEITISQDQHKRLLTEMAKMQQRVAKR